MMTITVGDASFDVTFTTGGGDTYEYPADYLADLKGYTDQIPVSEHGQMDLAVVECVIYQNQTYIDGVPQKKKVKHITTIVEYYDE
jgi:hypothetical protein